MGNKNTYTRPSLGDGTVRPLIGHFVYVRLEERTRTRKIGQQSITAQRKRHETLDAITAKVA
jgi:hypothetical protein